MAIKTFAISIVHSFRTRQLCCNCSPDSSNAFHFFTLAALTFRFVLVLGSHGHWHTNEIGCNHLSASFIKQFQRSMAIMIANDNVTYNELHYHI